jgi:large subunit ribosomal protein L4e
MSTLPVVSVFSTNGKQEKNLKMPLVFSTPIRLDIVQSVFVSMNKNARQAYAVSVKAGHQTSAESWGTGRAVARIPRVSGGGTHRAGQAAFGNMCRGGRMFAPTKVWRKWHVKINKNQKRFATAAALAASSIAALVMARGHLINETEECPLVVDDSIQALAKTRKAIAFLKSVGAYDDVQRVIDSKTLRAGKGKWRNRRTRQRRGPLIVYGSDQGLVKAFRNIPGVELCSVDSLNLLQLAPGGHVGRFVIWTEEAFSKLDSIYENKKDYELPVSKISNPDLSRLINSDEIQSVLRPAGQAIVKRPFTQKKNPLVNKKVLLRFNPYAKVIKDKEALKQTKQKNKDFVAAMLQ